MKWIVVFLVFVADALIIFKNRFGFLMWFFCDGYFFISSISEQRWEEMWVFGLYSVMGLAGFLKWKKENKLKKAV